MKSPAPQGLILLFILLASSPAQAAFVWGGIVDVQGVSGLRDGSLIIVSPQEILLYPPDSSRPSAVAPIPIFSEANRPFSANTAGTTIATTTDDRYLIVLDEELSVVGSWNESSYGAGEVIRIFVSSDGARIILIAETSVVGIDARTGGEVWRFPCVATSGASFSELSGRVGFVCLLDPTGTRRSAFVVDIEGRPLLVTPPSDAISMDLSQSGSLAVVQGFSVSDLYRVPSAIPIWTDLPKGASVLGHDEAILIVQWSAPVDGQLESVRINWYPVPLVAGISDSYASKSLDGALTVREFANGEVFVIRAQEGDSPDPSWEELPSAIKSPGYNITFHRFDLRGQEVESGPAVQGHGAQSLAAAGEMGVFVDSYHFALFRANDNNERPRFAQDACKISEHASPTASVGSAVVDPDGAEMEIFWDWSQGTDLWKSSFLRGTMDAHGDNVALPEDWRDRQVSVAAVDEKGAFSIVPCDLKNQADTERSTPDSPMIILAAAWACGVAVFLRRR